MVGFEPPTPPPDYKSTVLTTRPPVAWYEKELNVHANLFLDIYDIQINM